MDQDKCLSSDFYKKILILKIDELLECISKLDGLYDLYDSLIDELRETYEKYERNK